MIRRPFRTLFKRIKHAEELWWRIARAFERAISFGDAIILFDEAGAAFEGVTVQHMLDLIVKALPGAVEPGCAVRTERVLNSSPEVRLECAWRRIQIPIFLEIIEIQEVLA